MQHDRTIFTNRVQHDGVVTRGDNLAHDVDALRFKPLEVIEMLWANNVVFSVVMFCYEHHGVNLKGGGLVKLVANSQSYWPILLQILQPVPHG
jgi:hypothetical protein